jgi:hypothetical protein
MFKRGLASPRRARANAVLFCDVAARSSVDDGCRFLSPLIQILPFHSSADNNRPPRERKLLYLATKHEYL